MKNYSYFFEVQELINQFITAFDDVVVKRYNNAREPAKQVEMRYILGSKQRVMHSIVNDSQNLTLPVAAVSINSLQRDDTRVFNKNNDLITYSPGDNTRAYKMPVPVNIGVTVTILTRYLTDLLIVASNHITSTNPYIIISVKVPKEMTGIQEEIRTEVMWDGSFPITEQPLDTNFSNKIRFQATMNLTIKGWLFVDKADVVAPIFYINTNYNTTATNTDLSLLTYDELLEARPPTSETISISALPQITNIFIPGDNLNINNTIHVNQNDTILIEGYNFQYTDNILLSSSQFSANVVTLSTESNPNETVEGIKCEINNCEVLSPNYIKIKIPKLSELNGDEFSVVILNRGGWVSTSFKNQLIYNG